MEEGDDLVRFIPDEEIYTIATTTQADMNISSGKTCMRKSIAGVELDASIESIWSGVKFRNAS